MQSYLLPLANHARDALLFNCQLLINGSERESGYSCHLQNHYKHYVVLWYQTLPAGIRPLDGPLYPSNFLYNIRGKVLYMVIIPLALFILDGVTYENKHWTMSLLYSVLVFMQSLYFFL